jgi:hypothetical protein
VSQQALPPQVVGYVHNCKGKLWNPIVEIWKLQLKYYDEVNTPQHDIAGSQMLNVIYLVCSFRYINIFKLLELRDLECLEKIEKRNRTKCTD